MSEARDAAGRGAAGEADTLKSARIDASRPASARVYDYLLGGKDNFPADRAAAHAIMETFPAIRTGARENRRFLHRAVRFLAAEAGIRQFLDIGTGIPTSPNVHETVQAVAPSSRIVYVDNDPIVLAHARALMTSHPDGEVAYLDVDARDPEAIIGSLLVRDVLDFSQPVALLLIAVLHFMSDDRQAADVVRTLVDALPAGSYVAASHITNEHDAGLKQASQRYRASGMDTRPRTAEEFEDLVFARPELELIAPGVVLLSEWRREPDDTVIPTAAEVSAYGGVARRR